MNKPSYPIRPSSGSCNPNGSPRFTSCNRAACAAVAWKASATNTSTSASTVKPWAFTSTDSTAPTRLRERNLPLFGRTLLTAVDRHGKEEEAEPSRSNRHHLLLALKSCTKRRSIGEMNDVGPKMIYRPREFSLHDHEARCVDLGPDDARWNAFNAAVERTPRRNAGDSRRRGHGRDERSWCGNETLDIDHSGHVYEHPNGTKVWDSNTTVNVEFDAGNLTVGSNYYLNWELFYWDNNFVQSDNQSFTALSTIWMLWMSLDLQTAFCSVERPA